MYLLKIKFLHQKRVCYLKHNEDKKDRGASLFSTFY